jgi:hypothetical protein
MAFDLYEATVPLMRRGLVNLRACVAKGAEHLAAAGKPEAELLEARLAPDMFTFTQQIRTACRAAERAVALLSGNPLPTSADDETSIAELLGRIDRAVATLDGASAEIINGRAGHEVVVPVPDMAIHFTDGGDYLRGFALPNFHFHCSIAYAIMRHLGAPLGKADFLGALDVRKAR